MTRSGALAGIIVGGLTAILWKQGHGGIFELYELVSGFFLSWLAIWIVSRVTKQSATNQSATNS